jgi:hypothetical protein
VSGWVAMSITADAVAVWCHCGNCVAMVIFILHRGCSAAPCWRENYVATVTLCHFLVFADWLMLRNNVTTASRVLYILYLLHVIARYFMSRISLAGDHIITSSENRSEMSRHIMG